MSQPHNPGLPASCASVLAGFHFGNTPAMPLPSALMCLMERFQGQDVYSSSAMSYVRRALLLPQQHQKATTHSSDRERRDAM